MPSFVQVRGAQAQGTGTSSFALAFTAPLTLGSAAFVALGYTDNGVLATTIDSSLGNAYTRIKRERLASRCVDYYQADGVLPGTETLTIHFSGGKSGVGVTLLEYATTAGTILSLNQQNSASDTASVTSYPHGSITTTEPIELILTVLRSGGSTNTISAPAGYTLRGAAGGNNAANVLERITAAPETTNPTPTGTQATAYVGMVLSFTEIADTSTLKLTQQVRRVLEDEAVPAIRITQMVRRVLYPFTCVPGAVPSDATTTYPIRRQRRCLLPSSPEDATMQIPILELLMRTGIGLTAGASGSPVQGEDPQVMLRISKDGGKTWGHERWVSAHALGKYAERVRWTRATGNYRNGVIEITVSDPVDWQFLAMVGEPIEGLRS